MNERTITGIYLAYNGCFIKLFKPNYILEISIEGLNIDWQINVFQQFLVQDDLKCQEVRKEMA
jgi:hypothetical protein